MIDLKDIMSSVGDLMGDNNEAESKVEKDLESDLTNLINFSKVADKAEAGEDVDIEKTGSEISNLIKFASDKITALNNEEDGKGDNFLQNFFMKNIGNLGALKKVYDFLTANGMGGILENLGGLKSIIDGDFSLDTLKKLIKW